MTKEQKDKVTILMKALGARPTPLTEVLLLRVNEAARLLGVSRTKTYELIATKTIPSIRVGRSVRVPRAALVEWILRNTMGGK